VLGEREGRLRWELEIVDMNGLYMHGIKSDTFVICLYICHSTYLI
jgi:hypothetical protein